MKGDFANGVLTKIPKTSVNYAVPCGTRVIGDYAAADCRALESAVIADGVSHIGLGAFEGCDKLKSVVLPDSVETIDNRAFEGCVALKRAELPEGVEILRQSTFCGCAGLEEIKLPSSLKSIEDYAFEGCVSLKKITLPPAMVSIGNCAFSGCKSLKKITAPPRTLSFGSGTFNGCLSLEEITLTIGNEPKTISLPKNKEEFSFFHERRQNAIFIKYIHNDSIVIKRIADGGGGPDDKVFEEQKDKCREIYKGYADSPELIVKLFKWLDIRDKKYKNADIPPFYIMDAMGKKENSFFLYKKRFYSWNKENAHFKALNVDSQAAMFKLLVLLGGFAKNDEIAKEAYALVDGILADPARDEFIACLGQIPDNCVPEDQLPTHMEKIALFKKLKNDAGFYPAAARFLIDYKRIRKLAIQERRAVQDIGADFVNSFISTHNLFIRNEALKKVVEPYTGDMDQIQANFLEYIYERALEIEKKHKSSSKAFIGGLSGSAAGGYGYVWPGMTDPRTLVLGFIADSCFRPQGAAPSEGNNDKGVSVLGEAVTSYDVAPLIIMRNDDIAAFAVVNYNAEERGLLVDNIEVVPECRRPGCGGEILRAIVLAVKSMKNEMNKAGRRVDIVNVRYDKSNDLMRQIKSDLTISTVNLRIRNYMFENCPVYSTERGQQWNMA